MSSVLKHKLQRTARVALTAALAVLSALQLSSCKEQDNAVDEYPNWQATNDRFVASLASDSLGQPGWQRFKAWTLAPKYEGDANSYVYVKVIESGDPAGTLPLANDSVSITYSARLLPSVSYPQGRVVDQSYVGSAYIQGVSSPQNSNVNTYQVGFATALMNMRDGDHWLVYVPYALGYGTTDYNSVPAYSTMVFDLRLHSHWHKQ